MNSDDESEGDVGEMVDPVKFRVIASARMRSCVRVQDADVSVGPPDGADNQVNSPSWVGDIPLPRVLAERVTGSAIDHDAWDAVAAQAFSNDNGGFLKGFNRRTNALLNADADEGAKFQWDVKLTRNIAPQADLKNSNLTIMKYKTAKKCLDTLWAILRDRDVTPEVGETVETDWFLLPPKTLARWLEKHIMQEPTQSVRQLRSCRSHSPPRRRRRSPSPSPPPFPPPAPRVAPVAPAAGPAVPGDIVKQQFGSLMRRSKVVGDMLYSDAVLQWLSNGQAGMPANNLWAPRWSTYPIVRGRHLPIQDAGGTVVGEKFIIQLFNSAQSANALFPNDPALVNPAVFNMPAAVAPGGDGGDGGNGGYGSEGEYGGGVHGPEFSEEEGEVIVHPPVAPVVSVWMQQVNAAVAAYNASASALRVQPVDAAVEADFPLSQQDFETVCAGTRGTNLFAKLLTYEQAKEVWEDRMTHVLQKRGMLLLKFFTKDTDKLVGYVIMSPLDLDICRVAVVCSSSVMAEWTRSQLEQMFKKFKPKQKVPSSNDELKLAIIAYFLQQLGVVVPADMRTLDEVAELLDGTVREKLDSFRSLYRFVFMEETRDKKPLPPAVPNLVKGFNDVLQYDSYQVMEVHAACGSRAGNVQVGDVMMRAVVSLCSSLRYKFVCVDIDSAVVNYRLLEALGYKQGNLFAYAAYIREGRFEPQYFLRGTQQLLNKYAFTFVPAKKDGE